MSKPQSSIACEILDAFLQECDEWDESSHLKVLDTMSESSVICTITPQLVLDVSQHEYSQKKDE